MTRLSAPFQRKQVLSLSPIDLGSNRTIFIALVNKTAKSIREPDNKLVDRLRTMVSKKRRYSPTKGQLRPSVVPFAILTTYWWVYFASKRTSYQSGLLLHRETTCRKGLSCSETHLRQFSSENSFQNSWVQIPVDPKRKFANALAF